jgi:hypothetical protein
VVSATQRLELTLAQNRARHARPGRESTVSGVEARLAVQQEVG